jgi:hypothetical protein
MDGATYEHLKRWLREENGISVSVQTLKRRFQEWKIQRRITMPHREQIKARITYFVFDMGLNDTEISTALRGEGHTMMYKPMVARLRKELGIKRSLRKKEDRDHADWVIRGLVEDQLKKGVIDGYGKNLLQLHFKQQHMYVARDRLFAAYRELNPDAVARRYNDHQRRRGEYIVPGPNWCWSIDGHLKLQRYGIEVYACMDAYSRYIVWAYVGISAGTAVSVAHQYLHAVQITGVYPQFLRSDCGVETTMISWAHWKLVQADTPGATLSDVHMMGTSTANQRIEAWWSQLSKGLLFRWRVGILYSPTTFIYANFS